MTGKQSSPVSRSFSICLTVLLVSSLVEISSSVPLIKRNVRPLHLDDIGAYFRIVVNGIDIEGTNLSMELSGTAFDNLVCPIFGMYSRMQQTLLALSDDDSRHHSVSVLTFVLKEQVESLCERVKANCTEDQQCANMSCNVSSIILPCLHLDPPSDSVDGLWGPDQHLVGRENHVMIPLWLDEILSNGYPDGSILDTLESILEQNGAVNCCIPEEGSGVTIECTDNF